MPPKTVLLVPPEPSSFGLLVTGIVCIGLYLAITGRWRNLRRNASPYVAQMMAEQAAQQADHYGFCNYESRFAFSFGSICAGLLRDHGDLVIRRPPHVAIQPTLMSR